MNLKIPSDLLKESTDESDQCILDSARSLYVEFGLRRTTMEDVAKRAGMGRATLYRRFSEKDQLFKTVILRDLQRDMVLIEKEIEKVHSALDGLIEAFIKASLLMHRSELIKRLLATEPDHVLPYLTTDFDAILAFSRTYLTLQIQRGQKVGHIRNSDPEPLAEMLLRLLQSFMLTPNGVIDPSSEKSIRRFTELYLRPLLEP